MQTSLTITEAQRVELRRAAQQAAEHAYAPYSRFRVGAALLLESGDIVTAANVENTSYSLSMCAERAAIARAVAEHGPRIRIVAVAVTNLNNSACSPCGACRQTLAEFMGPDGLVLFPYHGAQQARTLAELLPVSFSLTHDE